MRVDLFLKRSRIIKQRDAAKKACDRGMVTISGRSAKPGHQVAAKDIVVVAWPDRRLEFEVLNVPEGNVSKDRAQSMYHVLSDERLNDDVSGFEAC
ncbi:MAG: RNA-binding S4 domain-containing protein [Gemmatimonadetes bacterium]|nr:RNA-binding S4 domain-containing protein [Gemmatimonadota bacterium]MYB60913.1 RNA-binding S4 domain-containing protein [Gemmatimonadota bacterium]